MKVESRFFLIQACVFTPIGIIYGIFTRWSEPVGTTALFLLTGLGGLIAFYLNLTGRRIGSRPEDDPSAPIEAAEGDFGFFSPHSWWPLPLGAGAAMMFLGLAVGWWLTILGIPLALFALVGWTFEYFRGEYAA